VDLNNTLQNSVISAVFRGTLMAQVISVLFCCHDLLIQYRICHNVSVIDGLKVAVVK